MPVRRGEEVVAREDRLAKVLAGLPLLARVDAVGARVVEVHPLVHRVRSLLAPE